MSNAQHLIAFEEVLSQAVSLYGDDWDRLSAYIESYVGGLPSADREKMYQQFNLVLGRNHAGLPGDLNS